MPPDLCEDNGTPQSLFFRGTSTFFRPITTTLPPPVTNELDVDAIWAFRKNYQKFRKGCYKGAKGELSDLLEEESDSSEEESPEGSIHDIEKPLFSVGLGDDELEDSAAEKLTPIMQRISEFRSKYRAFRRGGTPGVFNFDQLSRFMTNEHVLLLPVSQASQLKSRRNELNEAEKKNIPLGFRPAPLHIHFGAGKLGIGLLSIALKESHRPFVMFDPPFAMWEPLLSNKCPTVDFVVNGEKIQTLRVVRPGDQIPKDFVEYVTKQSNHPAGCPPLPYNLLVLSDDNSVLDAVCALAAPAVTFSTSVGPALPTVAQRILEAVSKATRDKQNAAGYLKPTLYGCENNHQSVEDLRPLLGGTFDVVVCMVDRICAERNMSESSVEILTEPDRGSIVVLTPSHLPNYAPSFAGKNVIIPLVEAAAKYLSNRKITMVNGMHTTLAFTTLCSCEPKDYKGAPGSHPLLTPKTLTDEQNRSVWCWAVARVLMLLDQHDPEIIKFAHNFTTDDEVIEELLTFGRRTLNRFSTVDDTTGRVLGGGVATRWKGRLKPVDNFLMQTEVSSIPLGKNVLRAAKVSESLLLRTVRGLTENSYRFTELDRGNVVGY